MIISPTYRFIFVAIPKTGSTAVERTLASVLPAGEIYSTWGAHLPKEKRLKHLKAAEIRERIGQKEFSTYEKFATVRHPYSLAVSWYKYLMGITKFYTSRGLPVNHPWNDISDTPSFDAFIARTDKWIVHQYKYICDENSNVLVNNILTFDNLNDEFSRFTRKVGISSCRLKRENVSMHTPHEDDMSYYKSDKAKAIVQRALKRDFEIFGFKK